MKKQGLIFLGIASLALLSGCDVSNSGGGGESQAPDPVVVDFPIAYIERPLPRDEDGLFVPSNVLDITAFNPGARLIFKDRASVPASEVVITDIAFMPEPEIDPDTGEEIPLPEDFRPMYDVKDLSVSPDGMKLLFSMRAPEIEDADEEDQPTWNIWEYDLETEILRRIIESDIIAEEGQDIGPGYLADGRIIFSSNRQRRSRAVLLDENKPQFAALTEDGEAEAFVLHVMEENGLDIKQITFNQSHDLFPTQLNDGRIMFLRWDNFADSKDRLSLYTANPNGSNVNIEYGFHSQNTGSNDSEGVFFKPRELDDGRIEITLRPRISERLGGDMVAIDTVNFTELMIAATGTGASGPAQESIVGGEIVTDGSPSPAGYFSSAYPIEDGTGRLLVSWSPCQLSGYKLGIYVDDTLQLIGENGQFVTKNGDDTDTPVTVEMDEVGNYPCTPAALALDNIVLAEPVYGLWIFDPGTQTQAPVVLSQIDTMYTEALVMQARALPDYIPDPIPGVDFDQELADENVGIIHIHSVYDLDGTDISPNGIFATADPLQTTETERPARFIRILKAVSMADDDVVDFDNSAFAGQPLMYDILGYVPIEPDGSAMFRVPADVAFTFSILNSDGKRVTADGSGTIGPKHEYWMSLRAGEVRECTGCHADGATEIPHGRFNAEHQSLNSGALAAANFPNTQLRDEFGTPHTPPEVGETMAQYYARVNGARTPTMDLIDYSDWTENGTRPKIASIDYSYADLTSASPTECVTAWSSLCRTVINYLEHIQPIWEVDRRTFDPNDNAVVLSNNTCTSCHARQDADGLPMLPAGTPPRQLNLSSEQLDPGDNYVASFINIFGNNNQIDELIVDDMGNVTGIQEEQAPRISDENYLIAQMVLNNELQYVARNLVGDVEPAPMNTTNPELTLQTDANAQLIPFLIYVLDTNGERIIDNTATGQQYVYQIEQLSIGGTLQFQARTVAGDVVPAPQDTTDPNLTLLLNANDNPVSYDVFSYNADNLRLVFTDPSGQGSPAVMSHAGALRSDQFFDVFAPGGSHAGYLNGAELKLIAEWLDIGGQYYNNQFDAP